MPEGGNSSSPGCQTLAQIAEHACCTLDVDEEYLDEFDALCDAEKVRALYTQSDCDNFACALHRVTGWPLVVASFRDREVGVGHHTLVQGPDGRLLDAGGWTNSELFARKLRKKVKFSAPGSEELASLGASVGENVHEGADGCEVDPDLAMAVSAIRQLPWAPYQDSWFREMSARPVGGVDPASVVSRGP